ncbi:MULTISPECIES: hypothetical protein [unclassified Anaerobiospirillum]|uniref:hypothetical protein n=1 Tax=unclassified Anaerobiospirillum TaxID=2647410 RepID=UPI001FF26AE0|nr:MULTISPECIES: hypothetical protein [unclassified Anaerobiospirillum]MCK0533955.1 hypothetical protein [Anaerobiospirillum sp. NML120511]MCK0539158.1 hypothetical protein [Anaerobiospirillum sp. NML02-A-032]
MNKIVFEEVNEQEVFAEYTEGCSGERSACCTRVCTRDMNSMEDSEEKWGQFLSVEGGVIQY